jgi:hypothetical protein
MVNPVGHGPNFWTSFATRLSISAVDIRGLPDTTIPHFYQPAEFAAPRIYCRVRLMPGIGSSKCMGQKLTPHRVVTLKIDDPT